MLSVTFLVDLARPDAQAGQPALLLGFVLDVGPCGRGYGHFRFKRLGRRFGFGGVSPAGSASCRAVSAGAPPRQPALLRGFLFGVALVGLGCLAHRTPSGKQRAVELTLEGERDAAGHQHVAVAQPFDGERAALDDHLGMAVTRPRRLAATAAAQAPEPQASVMPAPRSQTRSLSLSSPTSWATPMLARSGKNAVVLELRPKLGKRDGVGIVDEEGGVRIAHVGAHGILQGADTERQVIGVAGLATGISRQSRRRGPCRPRSPAGRCCRGLSSAIRAGRQSSAP